MPDGLEAMPLDTAARLLRAKAHELENHVQVRAQHPDGMDHTDFLRADVALVAELLAVALDRIGGASPHMADLPHPHDDPGAPRLDSVLPARGAGRPNRRSAAPLAELLFTWTELDMLALLVDDRLRWDEVSNWQLLNSLRTALREAQSGLPPDRVEP